MRLASLRAVLGSFLRSMPGQGRSRARQRGKRRLNLEQLEARLVPTFTWTGGGLDKLWSDGANWQGGVAPTPATALGDTLSFAAAPYSTAGAVNDIVGLSVGQIQAYGAPASGGVFLSGNAITLTGVGGIGIDCAGNGLVMSNAITLANSLSFSGGGTGMSLSGVISGSADLTISGCRCDLNQINTYTGTTTVMDRGYLVITSDACLGPAPTSPTPGSLVLSGGTLSLLVLLCDFSLADS